MEETRLRFNELFGNFLFWKDKHCFERSPGDEGGFFFLLCVDSKEIVIANNCEGGSPSFFFLHLAAHVGKGAQTAPYTSSPPHRGDNAGGQSHLSFKDFYHNIVLPFLSPPPPSKPLQKEHKK